MNIKKEGGPIARANPQRKMNRIVEKLKLPTVVFSPIAVPLPPGEGGQIQ